MIINDEKKEVHVPPDSLHNLAVIIGIIRSQSKYEDYKIMIDGPDEDTVT